MDLSEAESGDIASSTYGGVRGRRLIVLLYTIVRMLLRLLQIEIYTNSRF